MTKKSKSHSKPGKKPIADVIPAAYSVFLEDLKVRIRAAQVRAALAVNSERGLLYWRIGRDILRRQADEGWGAKVIDRLGRDLQTEFPGGGGFSPRNLKYMRAFAEAWPDKAIVQQAVAQIPWGHNVTLLDKLKSQETRLWYARQAIAHGWSRNVLALQIESEVHARQGKAVTNFGAALPPPQSDLAREVLKDPYNFDFLTLADKHHEADVERGLLAHIRQFLLELGAGFAFVGQQVHLEVGSKDFYIDLLFYHLHLRCYIVIDLKVDEFEPEHAGKMNFYLSAVDDQLRHPQDQPSIGIILCRSHEKIVAEYALRAVSGNSEARTTQYFEGPSDRGPIHQRRTLRRAARTALGDQ